MARITLVDPTGTVQRLQVMDGDLGPYGGQRVIDKVAHVAQFGFASVPPIGSEVLLGSLDGLRSQTIAFGTNHQPSRPTDLADGDSCQFDERGQRVWLTKDGIVVDGAGLPVTVRNTPKVTVEADVLACTGDIVSRSGGAEVSLNKLHDTYNVHTHQVTAVGAPTNQPNQQV